jgi:hypothetical protein
MPRTCVDLRHISRLTDPYACATLRHLEPVDSLVTIDLYRPRGCGGGNRVAWVLPGVSLKLSSTGVLQAEPAFQ